MKKLIFSIILIISCLTQLYSQKPHSYSKIIQIPNIPADTLYLLSKQWFVTSFNTPKKVIQDDSKELKIISGRGAMEYSFGRLYYISWDGFVTYLIQIQSRDGRVKVDITNLIHENLPGYASTSNLGLITDEEIQYKSGIGKNLNNNVVNDIKKKFDVFSELIYVDIEKYILTKNLKEEKEW